VPALGRSDAPPQRAPWPATFARPVRRPRTLWPWPRSTSSGEAHCGCRPWRRSSALHQSPGPHPLSAQAPDQVARLIEAAPGPSLEYKAALGIAYGAGLRGGEVVMLRIGDIDSEHMLSRVEMGKGRKDRHAMLSPQLLSLLRAWWLQCRSRGWLFPGRDPLLPTVEKVPTRIGDPRYEGACAREYC
jgi:Phage integrase family